METKKTQQITKRGIQTHIFMENKTKRIVLKVEKTIG